MPSFQIRWGSKMIPGFVKRYLNFYMRTIYYRRVTKTRVVSSTEASIISIRGGGIVMLL